MNLFTIYFIFFGISTVFGVPLLSLFQVTQIKGSTFMDWVSGLGATLGPAAGIFIIVTLIAYYILKPVNNLIEEAKTRVLSDDEKKLAMKKIKLVNTISVICLICGYILGNGTTIVIKTISGKLKYGIVDILLIFVLIIAYSFIAIQYAVNCFNALSRKQLSLLRIKSTEGFKTNRFTTSLGMTFLSVCFLIGWHLFCTAYSAVRHEWDIQLTMKKAFSSLIIGCCISLPSFFIILNQLRLRFDITINQVKTLRENGDLTERLDIGTFDDFGQVMTEMNNLMAFLKNSLSKLKEESSVVDTDATEVYNVSENSAAGMSQVFSAFNNVSNQNKQKDELLKETTGNISKLNHDALQISQVMQEQANAEEENATQIKQMVESINSVTESIQIAKNLSESLKASSDIGSEEVQKTQVIIEEINEKSKKMIEVIQVIQKVASQTNLLAMNAAIEAAHAGEAGKGFSVVADEIRNLAENTQKQTKNINDLISEITISIMNGSDSMKETKQSFDKIQNEISEQNSIVDTISQTMTIETNNTKDILNNTNTISIKINDVNQLVLQQAKYTEEIKSSIDNVSQLSDSVNKAMDESEIVLRDFYTSIETVKDKAMKNHNSVMNITEQLNKFKID